MIEPSIATPRWHCLHLAKRGNRPEEIEDVYAASDDVGRYSVADGVTDSIFSNLWARLLVDRFITSPPTESSVVRDWLAAPREAWRQDVSHRALPWYSEHKLELGAAATFAGLQIHPDNTWTAVAVGDACLFHLRGGNLLASFPIEQSTSFNNRPNVLRSISTIEEPSFQRASGQWQSADVFVLTTDALAQFLIVEHEHGRSASDQIQRLISWANDQSAVERELNALRDSHQLRNDDVVIVTVDL